MIGPGKYDDALTRLREETKARGAALIVVEGERGMGFSVQMDLPSLLRMPAVLRDMASQIEADIRPPGLGATGEFPDGLSKVHAHHVSVVRDREADLTFVFVARLAVAWLGLPPAEAMQYARLIMKHATDCAR